MLSSEEEWDDFTYWAKREATLAASLPTAYIDFGTKFSSEELAEWLPDDTGSVPQSQVPTMPKIRFQPDRAYAGPACNYCGEKDHGSHFNCGCPNRGKLCACGAL